MRKTWIVGVGGIEHERDVDDGYGVTKLESGER